MKPIDHKIGLLFSDVARMRILLFDQMMQPEGLTHVQVFVLSYLFKSNGLTHTELSKLLGIGTVTVTGLVDRLEAKGWVTRKTDDKDRRAKRVWLTPKSGTIKDTIARYVSELNTITLEGLTEEEADQLISMLKVTRSNLSKKVGKKHLKPGASKDISSVA